MGWDDDGFFGRAVSCGNRYFAPCNPRCPNLAKEVARESGLEYRICRAYLHI